MTVRTILIIVMTVVAMKYDGLAYGIAVFFLGCYVLTALLEDATKIMVEYKKTAWKR